MKEKTFQCLKFGKCPLKISFFNPSTFIAHKRDEARKDYGVQSTSNGFDWLNYGVKDQLRSLSDCRGRSVSSQMKFICGCLSTRGVHNSVIYNYFMKTNRWT